MVIWALSLHVIWRDVGVQVQSCQKVSTDPIPQTTKVGDMLDNIEMEDIHSFSAYGCILGTGRQRKMNNLILMIVDDRWIKCCQVYQNVVKVDGRFASERI